MKSEKPLKNKVAVISGAGRGIGKSIALTFAKAGADIAICSRSPSEIEIVASLIREQGSQCLCKVVDVSVASEVVSYCDTIKERYEHVDLLVNNAGVYLERGSFIDSNPEKWWKTIEVNVRGPFLFTRNLISIMRPGGKIINVTSGKGFSAGNNSSAYHVSKAALNMMTDSLANELWQQEIAVNHLIPGPTATATFDTAPPGQERSPEEILSLGPEALPKGLPAWERVKHPDEVAAFALNMATQPIGGPTGQIFSLARRPI